VTYMIVDLLYANDRSLLGRAHIERAAAPIQAAPTPPAPNLYPAPADRKVTHAGQKPENGGSTAVKR
jgi:hypothetical protein